MLHQHRSFTGAVALLTVGVVGALVVIACQDAARSLATSPARVRSDVTCGGSGGCPPPPECITGKWTGGGRIDPPSNHDVADEMSGAQPTAPSPPPPLVGKVTFGFNVFLGSDANGNCVVNKGEIEVNGHLAKIAWHVSIHDGIDAFSNQPVFAETFADASGGQCVVVGVGPQYMIARANPQQGTELVQFEGCDNDRGGPQNSRTDAMRWRTYNHGDTGLTYLTGGNIVDHGS
ncbi:MAG TPA: hypothetical protein VEU55_10280 [Gemmatimonadales bacterium]|nr:hypothetical protein [Gemmatimonadales bacterium]